MSEKILPKSDAAFPSTVLGRGISWLARCKRMLFIVSPFLVIVTVLVALAIASIDILAAGRAYVEGESLWSKNQKESVFHLLRYAETGNEGELANFERAIRSPLGFKQARLELEKPNPDYNVVYSGFLEGGTHPGWRLNRLPSIGSVSTLSINSSLPSRLRSALQPRSC